MKTTPNAHVIDQMIKLGRAGSWNIFPVIIYAIKNFEETIAVTIESAILLFWGIGLGNIPLVITTAAKIILNTNIFSPLLYYLVIYIGNEDNEILLYISQKYLENNYF